MYITIFIFFILLFCKIIYSVDKCLIFAMRYVFLVCEQFANAREALRQAAMRHLWTSFEKKDLF